MPDSTAPIYRVPGGSVRHRRPADQAGDQGRALCGFYGWPWRQVAEGEGRECRECARRAWPERRSRGMTREAFIREWTDLECPGYTEDLTRDVDRLLDAARRDERRACLQAVLKEQVPEEMNNLTDNAYRRAIEDAAGAIRARGEAP